MVETEADENGRGDAGRRGRHNQTRYMIGTVDKDGSGDGGGDVRRSRQQQQRCVREARQWGQKKRCRMMRETEYKNGIRYAVRHSQRQ